MAATGRFTSPCLDPPTAYLPEITAGAFGAVGAVGLALILSATMGGGGGGRGESEDVARSRKALAGKHKQFEML